MGAHLKNRTMMKELDAVGISTAILKQGEYRWKVIAGGNHKTFRHRITCNKFLQRIHQKEIGQTLLIKE